MVFEISHLGIRVSWVEAIPQRKGESGREGEKGTVSGRFRNALSIGVCLAGLCLFQLEIFCFPAHRKPASATDVIKERGKLQKRKKKKKKKERRGGKEAQKGED